MAKIFGVEIAKCPRCSQGIGKEHPYRNCFECGQTLPVEILSLLPAGEPPVAARVILTIAGLLYVAVWLLFAMALQSSGRGGLSYSLIYAGAWIDVYGNPVGWMAAIQGYSLENLHYLYDDSPNWQIAIGLGKAGTLLYLIFLTTRAWRTPKSLAAKT